MTAAFAPTRIAALAVPARGALRGGLPPTQRTGAATGSRTGLINNDGLTLEHFLLRARFTALYRSLVRATRGIPNPEARRDTLAWLRSDLFPPSLGLERDLVNLKEALAQGYRQLKQVQGQFSLLGAGGIRTMESGRGGSQGASSTGTSQPDTLHDPAGYTAFLSALLAQPPPDRLVLDLRPEPDFAARHLRNATHLPGGWAEFHSRFSTYLPAKGRPFLVLCRQEEEVDVRRKLGEREGLIGIVVCSQGATEAASASAKGSSMSAEEALLDPLGASEAAFWSAAEREGVLRTSSGSASISTGGSGGSGRQQGDSGAFSSPSGSKRGAHTLARSPSSSIRSRIPGRAADDVPHLMGQPSPALRRMHDAYLKPALLQHTRRAHFRALDLGCGAGRDLAWLAYQSEMAKAHEGTEEPQAGVGNRMLAWRVTGLDNVKPVLQRAASLMEGYALLLPPTETTPGTDDVTTGGCEALVWGQIGPRGDILALRAASRDPDSSGRKGKPFLLQDNATEPVVETGLLPQGASVYAPALPLKDGEPFDLVLLVRFLPRALLWDRADTMHDLVRRGDGGGSASTNRGEGGGFVLLSHFVVPEEDEAKTLAPESCGGRPPLRREYDAPPLSARLQAGEVRRLVAHWNAWWGAASRAGAGAGADGDDRGGEEWALVADEIEPIEDGRAVQSVLIRRR